MQYKVTLQHQFTKLIFRELQIKALIISNDGTQENMHLNQNALCCGLKFVIQNMQLFNTHIRVCGSCFAHDKCFHRFLEVTSENAFHYSRIYSYSTMFVRKNNVSFPGTGENTQIRSKQSNTYAGSKNVISSTNWCLIVSQVCYTGYIIIKQL